MGGIDRYAVSYRRLHRPLLRRAAAQLLQAVEQKRMVGNDEVTPAHNGFADHFRRNVCGQEDGAYVASRVTYLQSRVIPALLGTPWRYRLYAIDNGS